MVQRTSSSKLDPFSKDGKTPIQLFDPKEKTKIELQEPAKILEFPKKYEKLELEPAARPRRYHRRRHRSDRHAVLTPRDTTLVNAELIKNFEAKRFESWCISLLGEGEGCPFSLEPDDEEWFNAEIAGAEDEDSNLSERSLLLTGRADRKPIKFRCGEKAPVDVFLKPYPSPAYLKKLRRKILGKDIPLMLPLLKCETRTCPVKEWKVEPVKPEEKPDVVILPTDSENGQWSSECTLILEPFPTRKSTESLRWVLYS